MEGGWHEATDPPPVRLIQMMFSGGQEVWAGAEVGREDMSASGVAPMSVPRALRVAGRHFGGQGQLCREHVICKKTGDALLLLQRGEGYSCSTHLLLLLREHVAHPHEPKSKAAHMGKFIQPGVLCERVLFHVRCCLLYCWSRLYKSSKDNSLCMQFSFGVFLEVAVPSS